MKQKHSAQVPSILSGLNWEPHADSPLPVSAFLLQQHSTSKSKSSCQASLKVFFRVLPRSSKEKQEGERKENLHLNIKNKATAMHQAVTTVTVGSNPRVLNGDWQIWRVKIFLYHWMLLFFAHAVNSSLCVCDIQSHTLLFLLTLPRQGFQFWNWIPDRQFGWHQLVWLDSYHGLFCCCCCYWLVGLGFWFVLGFSSYHFKHLRPAAFWDILILLSSQTGHRLGDTLPKKSYRLTLSSCLYLVRHA